MRFIITACAAAIIAATQAFAEPTEDVVYLDNGGIVRGTILEHEPDRYLKIMRQDGKEFNYRMQEIVKIARQPVLGASTFRQKKSPLVALGLSFPIVGSGQFYNGNYVKGGAQLSAATVGLGLILSANGDNSDTPDGNLDADDDDWKNVPGYVLLLGGAIWSLVDAPMSASRINREIERESYGHAIEFDRDRSAFSIDSLTSRKRFGALLTLRF
ncbi:MAG: hypothetical protein OXN17_02990 [Candidatus Poribacteria bacterium]|nr:hypothetical protein [Candidatus Poribacteria bacterium]MDE0502490.1 hypothetical protein [Candidatus Poribacteria bacterium]